MVVKKIPRCMKCGKRGKPLKIFFEYPTNNEQIMRRYCLSCYLQRYKDKKAQEKSDRNLENLL